MGMALTGEIHVTQKTRMGIVTTTIIGGIISFAPILQSIIIEEVITMLMSIAKLFVVIQLIIITRYEVIILILILCFISIVINVIAMLITLIIALM